MHISLLKVNTNRPLSFFLSLWFFLDKGYACLPVRGIQWPFLSLICNHKPCLIDNQSKHGKWLHLCSAFIQSTSQGFDPNSRRAALTIRSNLETLACRLEEVGIKTSSLCSADDLFYLLSHSCMNAIEFSFSNINQDITMLWYQKMLWFGFFA